MHSVQKLQHARRGEAVKRKIHQIFDEPVFTRDRLSLDVGWRGSHGASPPDQKYSGRDNHRTQMRALRLPSARVALLKEIAGRWYRDWRCLIPKVARQ